MKIVFSKNILAAGLLALALILSCSKGSFTDTRDNKTYKTVKIGNQVWMAENLNYETENSECYDNNLENCQKYGRLYILAEAMKACPSDWHLPINKEWNTLIDAAGGEATAGKYLKSKSGWEENGNGEDKFGFAALPGGDGSRRSGYFYGAGRYGNWWSGSNGSYYYREMGYDVKTANWGGYDRYDYVRLRSVRCVRD